MNQDKEQERISAEQETLPETLPAEEEKERYHPRPKYQLVTAWVLLAIVVVGVILWLLEIGTAGALFGLLK